MITGPGRARGALTYLAAASFIWIGAQVFDAPTMQVERVTVPFLTGAANFSWGGEWLYNPQDIYLYEGMSQPERQAHRLQPSPPEELKPYGRSWRGFVYVVLVARTLFFWMGDLDAIESLNLACHILITLLIASRLSPLLARLLFVAGYGMNPLVLWVTTFPYYYFWQVIPGTLLALYLVDRRFRLSWATPFAVGAIVLAHIIRPTVVLAESMFYVLAALRERWPARIAGAAVLLPLALLVMADTGPGKNPWHTAYVGIAAYPNEYVTLFADRAAFVHYEELTGEKVDKGAEGNHHDPEVRRRLRELNRQDFLEIARKEPLMMVRNAILNVLQSFSWGYAGSVGALNYVSSFVGLCVAVFLVWRRRFLFVVAIGLSAGTFTPYFPPIPVYMFGSYVLLVAGMTDAVRDFGWFRQASDRLADRLGVAS